MFGIIIYLLNSVNANIYLTDSSDRY